MKYSNHSNWKKKGPIIFLFFIGGIIALTTVVMWLWNTILPEVINVTTITFWQAFGILILSKILFGGFKFGSHHRKKHHRFKEKFMNMSDEQKVAFKEEWRSRCRSYYQEE